MYPTLQRAPESTDGAEPVVCTNHPPSVYHRAMSRHIHDESEREQSRKKQVKFRADAQLVEQFDDTHENRSEALRQLMRQSLGAADHDRAPLSPPCDDPHRTAYLRLVELANADGVVRHEYAVQELAKSLGMNQNVVKYQLLHPLRKRCYIRLRSNIYGGRAWKLNGWENGE